MARLRQRYGPEQPHRFAEPSDLVVEDCQQVFIQR
jgi:hypothetical protein